MGDQGSSLKVSARQLTCELWSPGHTEPPAATTPPPRGIWWLSPGFGGKRDKQVVGAVIQARHHAIWGPGTPPRTPDGTTRSGSVESSLFFFLSSRGMCRLLMSSAVSFFSSSSLSPVKGLWHKECVPSTGVLRGLAL